MAPARRVAVFRALQLGDVLAALPALRALRACFAPVHLTLIGQAWAAGLARRLPWLDDFLPFPGHPLLPEQQHDAEALARFHAEVRARRFDVAVQMHGDGRVSNAIVAAFGAGETAGFHPAEQPCPDPRRFVAWPAHGREVERLMRLPDHLGAGNQPLFEPLVPLAEDWVQLDRLWPGWKRRPYVCIHPGARFPSRRWPVERFARVAQALRDAGLEVVLTGSAGEADVLTAFRRVAPPEVIDLSARTGLGTLAALIRQARLLVANDTGVSHLAAALRTPSVIVASGSDASRWAPVNEQLHRVMAHPVACRPCMHLHCPTGHECAHGIEVEAVLDQVRALLQHDRPKGDLHAA